MLTLNRNHAVEAQETRSDGVRQRVGQASRRSPACHSFLHSTVLRVLLLASAPQGGVFEVRDRRDACPTTSFRLNLNLFLNPVSFEQEMKIKKKIKIKSQRLTHARSFGRMRVPRVP